MLAATLRRLYQSLWVLALVVLVFLALYASLGRQYIGLVKTYQHELLSQISQRTGVEVSAESLDGRWSGLSPVLVAHKLALGNQQSLTADRLRVELDFFASLLTLSPRIRELHVGELRLAAEQDSNGHWRVPGLGGSAGADGGLDPLIDAVLAVRRGDISSLSLDLRYDSGARSSVRADEFSLVSDGHFRRGFAQLNAGGEGGIRILVEGYGDPRDSQFHAEAYVSAQDSRFSSLSPLLGDSAPLIDSPVEGELWFTWREGWRLSLLGELRSSQLAVGALWGSDEVLDDVAMRFTGSHRDGFWRISMAELDANWRGERIDLAGLSVRHPEPSRWRFLLPQLDLASASSLVRDTGYLAEKWQSVVDTLAPAGVLRNIAFDLQQADQGIEDYQLRAELADVEVSPWRGAPGAKGLNGFLEVGKNRGLVIVDTPVLELAFPGLYETPFVLGDARGELRWIIADQRLHLYSGPISALDEKRPLAALLRLDLPLVADAEVAPQMTLLVSGQDVPASRHRLFVPQILSKDLRDWLADAIEGGTARRASFLYRGSLRDEDVADRAIQLSLDLADVALAYHSEWPVLRAESAYVELDNGRLRASASDASILNSSRSPLIVSDVAVAIAENVQGTPTLRVKAAAAPTFDQVQNLFVTTPLDDLSGEFVGLLDGQGRAAVDFNMTLPLKGKPDPSVDIDANLNLESLVLPVRKLELTDIKGRLYYRSDQGISSESIKARLFGQPIGGLISQSGNAVRVDAQGRVAVIDLARWLQQPVLGLFDGASDMRLSLVTAGEDRGVHIQSDLKGVGMVLPSPFGKSADAARPLRLDAPLGDGAVAITIGDNLRLDLGLRDGDVYAGGLQVGDLNTPLLDDGYFTVGGSLGRHELQPWQNLLGRYQSLMAANSAPSSDQQSGLVPRVRGLGVETLSVGSFTLDDVSADVDWLRGAIRVDLMARQLDGSIAIPDDGGNSNAGATVYQVNLQRLQLPDDGDGAVVVTDDADSSTLDPRSFPNADVDIASLKKGEKDWGNVAFALRSDSAGATIGNIRGRLLGIELNRDKQPATLRWLYSDDGTSRSQLQGSFGVGNIGNTLSALGYGGAVESKGGQFDVDLAWPGPPQHWQLADTEGRVSYRLEDGRFLRASEAASGTLRVLSVFNMANIVRRLKFDFRDIFSKGIHFDEMRGDMAIADGILNLASPLIVEGPSSRFEMSGQINLITEVPDMRLVATLPVGSNLPWVAALIGGLPAAAGAYLVSKIFEEQVDSVASAVYDVGGTLQKPELSFRKIFDVPLPRGRDGKKVEKRESNGEPAPSNGDESAAKPPPR